MGAVKDYYHDLICQREQDDTVSTCERCGGFGFTGRHVTCLTCQGRGVVGLPEFAPVPPSQDEAVF